MTTHKVAFPVVFVTQRTIYAIQILDSLVLCCTAAPFPGRNSILPIGFQLSTTVRAIFSKHRGPSLRLFASPPLRIPLNTAKLALAATDRYV
jgi:hypothetical protein